MAKPELQGVVLTEFTDPIRTALRQFTDISDGKVEFDDLDTAGQLHVIPGKPNYARSETTFSHLGQPVGNLCVIAFKPGDGTGGGAGIGNLKLDNITETYPYPRVSHVVPRVKKGWQSEVHLTLASRIADDVHADVRPNIGHLKLIGIGDGSISSGYPLANIGVLGNRSDYFEKVLRGEISAPRPTATSTIWYKHNGVTGLDWRQGDPHAVYNSHPEAIQVCGFIAISTELTEVSAEHGSLAHDLGAYPADLRLE